MTDPSFIDVYPDAVVRAGHATAGTSAHWQSWGGRIGNTFRSTGPALRSERVFVAVESYAGGVASGATRVGRQVAGLGVGTGSAGNVVGDSDGAAEQVLTRPAGAAAEQGSVLSRPVNATSAPV